MRNPFVDYINHLRWARVYPVKSYSQKLKVFRDYRNLYIKKGLTTDEYRDFRFDKQSETFRQSFLGLNEQRFYLDYLNPIKYFSIARNKYMAHKMLENTGVKKSELYCYYQPEGKVIASDEIANNIQDVCRILKGKNVSGCVIKTTESSHGDNVYVVNNIIFKENDCTMTLFNNIKLELSEILKDYPLIFEGIVNQTSQMASFNSSSVNTVRFMTALYPDGKARLVGIWFKIGRKGKCVDNAGSGGNVDGAVNPQNGELINVSQFDGWDKIKQIEKHPDSGVQISGVKINNWERIVEEVLHYQECFPYIKAAGWDIAITDDGPVVIEVNDFWDRTGQLFIRHGWRDEIRDCYLAWKNTGNRQLFGRRNQILSNNHITKIINNDIVK